MGRLTLQAAQKNVYKGPGAFDITRKGNEDPLGLVFAPSLEILQPVLDLREAGALTDEHWFSYVDAYVAEMRVSYQRHRETWRRMLAQPHLVLLCYCTDPERCHRTVLGRIWSLCGPVDFTGEVPPPAPLFTGVHICGGRRRRRVKCQGSNHCTRDSVGLCDYPLGGSKLGKTCDRPICRSCAVSVGHDRDYCLTHYHAGIP